MLLWAPWQSHTASPLALGIPHWPPSLHTQSSFSEGSPCLHSIFGCGLFSLLFHLRGLSNLSWVSCFLLFMSIPQRTSTRCVLELLDKYPILKNKIRYPNCFFGGITPLACCKRAWLPAIPELNPYLLQETLKSGLDSPSLLSLTFYLLNSVIIFIFVAYYKEEYTWTPAEGRSLSSASSKHRVSIVAESGHGTTCVNTDASLTVLGHAWAPTRKAGLRANSLSLTAVASSSHTTVGCGWLLPLNDYYLPNPRPLGKQTLRAC